MDEKEAEIAAFMMVTCGLHDDREGRQEAKNEAAQAIERWVALMSLEMEDGDLRGLLGERHAILEDLLDISDVVIGREEEEEKEKAL
jgi:hypothetical protein